MRFTEMVREATDPIWQRIFAHPFVMGIADGSLSEDHFRTYMEQDYLYLIEYSRVLALASAKATDLETMARLAELLNATLNVEMDLHRSFAARFGLSSDDLAAARPSPTTSAYTRHLLQVAYSGSLADVVASILPCQFGYHEIGLRLAARDVPGGRGLYDEWVRTYSSREYADLATWMRDLLDALASRESPFGHRRLESHYQTGCRYEWMFWQAVYTRESWPIEVS